MMTMGQTYVNDELTRIFRSEPHITQPAIPTNSQPLFLVQDIQERTLANEIKNLEQNYFQLKKHVKTPAIVQYNELAQLRRHASNPMVSRNWQSQMRLAVELMRLGRREEANWILNAIERRLSLDSELNAIYCLWLALIKAGAGDYNGAYQNAQNLLKVLPNQHGRAVLSFFRQLVQNAANNTTRNNLLFQLPDEE